MDEGAEVGRRIRQLRRERGVTMLALARETGMSRTSVARIEGGATRPSYDSLVRISAALGVKPSEILRLAEEEVAAAGSPWPEVTDVSVVRRDRRKSMALPGVSARWDLLTQDLRRSASVMLFTDEHGREAPPDTHTHRGEACVFVLEGTFEVTVGDECQTLEEGDSIYFPSSRPHAMRVVGDRPGRAIWVQVPPWTW